MKVALRKKTFFNATNNVLNKAIKHVTDNFDANNSEARKLIMQLSPDIVSHRDGEQ